MQEIAAPFTIILAGDTGIGKSTLLDKIERMRPNLLQVAMVTGDYPLVGLRADFEAFPCVAIDDAWVLTAVDEIPKLEETALTAKSKLILTVQNERDVQMAQGRLAHEPVILRLGSRIENGHVVAASYHGRNYAGHRSDAELVNQIIEWITEGTEVWNR